MSKNEIININTPVIKEKKLVYLSKTKDNKMFKIGSSNDLSSNRVKGLSTKWKLDLNKTIIVFCEKNHEMEKHLHRKFKDYNIKGLKGDGFSEFFDIKCFDEVINHILELQKITVLNQIEIENYMINGKPNPLIENLIEKPERFFNSNDIKVLDFLVKKVKDTQSELEDKCEISFSMEEIQSYTSLNKEEIIESIINYDYKEICHSYSYVPNGRNLSSCKPLKSSEILISKDYKEGMFHLHLSYYATELFLMDEYVAKTSKNDLYPLWVKKTISTSNYLSHLFIEDLLLKIKNKEKILRNSNGRKKVDYIKEELFKSLGLNPEIENIEKIKEVGDRVISCQILVDGRKLNLYSMVEYSNEKYSFYIDEEVLNKLLFLKDIK